MLVKYIIQYMKNQVLSPENDKKEGLRFKLDDVFILLVIIFVAFGSFGLGRLSTQIPTNIGGITLSNISAHTPETTQSANTISTVDNLIPSIADGGKLVASINGGKYHFPWCSGAQRINEENKVWFDSKEEALAGGYTPAANCKGLE